MLVLLIVCIVLIYAGDVNNANTHMNVINKNVSSFHNHYIDVFEHYDDGCKYEKKMCFSMFLFCF